MARWGAGIIMENSESKRRRRTRRRAAACRGLGTIQARRTFTRRKCKSSPKRTLRGRPEIRRRLAEKSPIALQRARVPVVEFLRLRLAAERRLVVQRLAQHFAAQPRPITARVAEMQVPDLIDLIRRRHGVAGMHGEEQKSPVFAQRAVGKGMRPAVLPRQTPREKSSRRHRVERNSSRRFQSSRWRR